MFEIAYLHMYKCPTKQYFFHYVVDRQAVCALPMESVASLQSTGLNPGRHTPGQGVLNSVWRDGQPLIADASMRTCQVNIVALRQFLLSCGTIKQHTATRNPFY